MSYLKEKYSDLVWGDFVNSFTQTTASTMPITPITVLVVDDQTLVHVAISQVLISQPEIKLVTSARNYVEAEKHATQLSPEIIWLDLHLAHSDSIAVIGRLKKLSPASRIMAFVDTEDEQEAFDALMEGAQGYCSKQDVGPDEIMSMIQRLCCGEFVLRPMLLTRLIQRLRNTAVPLWDSESGAGFHALMDNKGFNVLAQLTAREREILHFISQG